MRHGAEPWEDLAAELMVKRPAVKVLYGLCYPMGLSLDRIFDELRERTVS